jgi:hypothetical protein
MLERDIEDYLVKRVKAMGGEVRKVQWIGRNSAPDRLVMLPGHEEPAPGVPGGRFEYEPATIWVELKNPKTVVNFPADARERAQHREHERMRALGQRVEVIGTLYQVEALLS